MAIAITDGKHLTRNTNSLRFHRRWFSQASSLSPFLGSQFVKNGYTPHQEPSIAIEGSCSVKGE